MHVIVVGAGNIGTPLIEAATVDGNEVVVTESDERKAAASAREFGRLVRNDDATGMETLEDAGTDRADALISTTDPQPTS